MAITVTLQPDATTGKDTHIKLDAPTTNYGAETTLILQNHLTASTTSLLIDFTEILNLPRKLKVLSAELSLYCTDAVKFSTNCNWYEILKDWVETQATWNIYSTGNNWATAGAQGVTDINTVSRIVGRQFYETGGVLDAWNIWSLCENSIELRRAELIYGWKFKNGDAAGGNDATWYGAFASSDNATASLRPKLTIVYEPLTRMFLIDGFKIEYHTLHSNV